MNRYRNLIAGRENCGPLTSAVYGVILLAAAASAFAAEKKAWITSNVAEWRQGVFADGGVNTYIPADGSVRLINLWDFNGDGNFDIPVTCPQDYTETPDLFIYWASKAGFSPERKTALPTQGPAGGTAADLNQDGYAELIVCNRFDGEKNNLDSYIYWGSPDGFSTSRRTGLPTEAAEDVAVADLNYDGTPDIVFANFGSNYHSTVDNRQRSYVYFGNAAGYDQEHKLELKTVGATGVKLADVNGDGYTDILFSMEGNKKDDGGVQIYFNDGKGGFTNKRSRFLPGLSSSQLAVADLNQDGYADIVLANRCRIKEKPYPGVRTTIETTDVNSFIYWGGTKGYLPAHRLELSTPGATSVQVADLDGDGRIDMVFTCGKGPRADARPEGSSFIYWNKPEGFSPAHRTELETNNALDCAIADLNHDGYPDLVFANEQQEGDFNVDSYVYWGGKDGFSPQRRTSLPSQGASGVVLADFNTDGMKDIGFMNKREGRHPPKVKNFYVYPGDNQGRFSAERKWVLPGNSDDAYAVADMNADGYSDLLFFGSAPCIYWGGSRGLDSDHVAKLKLPYRGNTAAVADMDRDGFLDLIGTGDNHTFVVFGDAHGLSPSRSQILDHTTNSIYSGYLQVVDLDRDGSLEVMVTLADKDRLLICSPKGSKVQKTKLKMDNPCGLRLADLNRDGYLDIVAISEVNLKKKPAVGRPLYCGDARTQMAIFWGGKSGYSASRTTKLPTVGADDCTLADLNGDELLDIAVTSYHSGDHRHHPGYLYWNGPLGFDAERRDLLPMNASCGIFAADLNLDSYQDLVWANHVIAGDHRSYVSVVYGSDKGLQLNQMTKLPATGPHYFNFADIGNIYDRSDRFDYISQPFDIGEGGCLGQIFWEAETPGKTAVEFQIRVAPTRKTLDRALWRGPSEKQFYYEKSGSHLENAAGKWVQFKASLISPNQANSPVLHSVKIEFIPGSDVPGQEDRDKELEKY